MPIKFVRLIKSPISGKKFRVELTEAGKPVKVDFGASGMRDFTLINDKNSSFYIKDKEEREKVKNAYIARHRANEKWGYDGLLTAGFWSRWLLWNKPTLNSSLMDIKSKFKIG